MMQTSDISMPSPVLMKIAQLFRWFFAKGYAQGVFWFIMIALVSVTNDVFMRFLGSNLPVVEIVFFRFFFSFLTILPFVLRQGTQNLKTRNPAMHVLRAILGVGAIAATCYAVNHMHLADNTVIMFTEPIFFLLCAPFFLKEIVDRSRWMATLIGFAGLLVIVQPGAETFHPIALVSVTGAVLFALSDILVKKMVGKKENTVAMLFYFALGTTIVGFIPLLFIWQTPSVFELFMLFLLGIGGNLIQACLFRAFTATDASSLMPFRYVELILSSCIGFALFAEIPGFPTLIGSVLIIASTFYISYVETKKEAKLQLAA